MFETCSQWIQVEMLGNQHEMSEKIKWVFVFSWKFRKSKFTFVCLGAFVPFHASLISCCVIAHIICLMNFSVHFLPFFIKMPRATKHQIFRKKKDSTLNLKGDIESKNYLSGVLWLFHQVLRYDLYDQQLFRVFLLHQLTSPKTFPFPFYVISIFTRNANFFLLIFSSHKQDFHLFVFETRKFLADKFFEERICDNFFLWRSRKIPLMYLRWDWRDFFRVY